MKTAISLTDETFDRVERASRGLGISRSEFFVRAAERWLNALDDEETTEAIDRVIAGLPEDHAFTNAATAAPALRRPVLVISADQYNRSRLATVTVAVLTTNVRLAALPANVLISAELTALDDDSVVNVT
jgi:hypothetical protein